MPKLKTLLACAGLALAALLLDANAQATSGSIAGEAKAGDTIIVTNSDTGFKREMKISKDGKFQVRNIPTGVYSLIHQHADGNFEPPQLLEVRIGATARAKPPAAPATAPEAPAAPTASTTG